jgi:hypothetical protein
MGQTITQFYSPVPVVPLLLENNKRRITAYDLHGLPNNSLHDLVDDKGGIDECINSQQSIV